jgi:hypothetical protein
LSSRSLPPQALTPLTVFADTRQHMRIVSSSQVFGHAFLPPPHDFRSEKRYIPLTCSRCTKVIRRLMIMITRQDFRARACRRPIFNGRGSDCPCKRYDLWSRSGPSLTYETCLDALCSRVALTCQFAVALRGRQPMHACFRCPGSGDGTEPRPLFRPIYLKCVPPFRRCGLTNIIS